MRVDDIDLLRAVDAREEQANGAPLWSLNGLRLMEELLGGPVADTNQHRAFVKELHILRDAGLLTFSTYTTPLGEAPNPDRDANYYLQQVHSFALTPDGRDRARGQLIIVAVPDSAEDDGRPISRLVLEDVGKSLDAEYSSTQCATFFREAGIPIDKLHVEQSSTAYSLDVLLALDNWGSQGRRVLRGFLGAWLGDQLASGPAPELRSKITRSLSRQGWHIKDGRLVVGEKALPVVGAATDQQLPAGGWSPLSHRVGGSGEVPLEEGVPDWLYPHLQGWLWRVLQHADEPVKVLRPGHGLTEAAQRVMLRVRSDRQPWLIPADDPALLDAVDATLRWVSFDHHGFTSYGDSASLEALLVSANSAWRVSATGQGLERRLDDTVTAAMTMALATANAEAADHLRLAWDAAYGRSPDPDKAYDEAVLAVEALACPLVCPANPRRSLGTVIRDLRSQHGQWQLAIGDSAGQPASPTRLTEMLAILWEGQSRHGGSPNSRHQTLSEGRAAVHLAATVVQWLDDGILSRLP